MWQSEHVAGELKRLYPHCEVSILGITTRGDQIVDRPLAQIGGKGLFVKELEAALEDGGADLARRGGAQAARSCGANPLNARARAKLARARAGRARDRVPGGPRRAAAATGSARRFRHFGLRARRACAEPRIVGRLPAAARG